MKKLSFINLIAASFVAASLLTSCSSNADKENKAKEEVNEAKENLQEVKNENQEDAVKKANAEEWQAFKADAESKIKDHEARIAELKEKMKKSGKTMDALYQKKIDNLEARISDLKLKLDNYEKNQSDWQSFKTEFNHDMDEFGKAFKDLTVDNK